MNILQIRGEFSDNGPGTQCLTISTELRRRGHTVVLCSSGGYLEKKIRSLGFTYHIIPEIAFSKRNILNVLISIFKVRKILIQDAIDVVHGHNAAVITIANIAAFLAGKKIKFFQSVRGVECRKNYFFRNWIYKLNKFNALFAVSQFTKDVLLTFGVPDKKVIVTYNGTDLSRFDIHQKERYRKEIRDAFNIPETAQVIGIIGRQDGPKGHRFLIQSFKRLYTDFPSLYIVLVGEGKEFESNQALAKELGISDRTIFTGLRLDVEKLHASFDIFTLLSKQNYEMFPNVIVEAMSYAIPFVSTRTTGIPEMAKNGEGIICDCEDIDGFENAFRRLLEDPELSRKMGQKGRQTVEKAFNIGAVVSTIEQAYLHA